MSRNLSDSIGELSDVSRKYIQTRIDLVKLTILGKATQVTTYLISSFLLTMAGALILFFGLAAFVVWYGQVYHDYLTGLLLVTGLLVFMTVLFALFKEQLISSFVLRKYASMLFEEDEEEEEL
jgi:prepilin signal peptidase PulO-like enzyme (type II secretory pathway)